MRISKAELGILLAEAGITFAELAKQSGVSRQTISSIYNGKSCTPKTAGKIAKALGKEVAELLEV